MSLSLIVETPAPKESFEYIVEEGNSKGSQNFFIKGPYMMAEGVNRNKRIYPLEEMQREVKRYENLMVKTGRAMGELNHPSTADVDLERACHLVTEMSQDGNVFYGKSKVLSTPTGLIVRSLINDGVRVGMSSRALGQLIPESGQEGISRVQDFKLVAIDCVADPSFPKAFVNGILESKQYVVNAYGQFEEAYDKFEKTIATMPLKNKDQFLREHMLQFIKSL
jgi:hypothetical protein|tara:strand:+ start:235 stop:903 length:669 start_codon:yes stop_codon:yes gene_type:complete